jgi:hypothetical protein
VGAGPSPRLSRSRRELEAGGYGGGGIGEHDANLIGIKEDGWAIEAHLR